MANHALTWVGLALVGGCASTPSWSEPPSPRADGKDWCVGDVELHRRRGGHTSPVEIHRDGDEFTYRHQPVPAALVRSFHEPLVGALPAPGRCTPQTRGISVQPFDSRWEELAPALAACRDSAAPADADVREALLQLFITIAAIDVDLDETASGPASVDRCDREALRPLVATGFIDVWSFRGGMPLEIAAQHTASETTAAQVASIAGALREPMPGFAFESFTIWCSPSQNCRDLDLILEGDWHGLDLHFFGAIRNGQPHIPSVSAAIELLGSPLVATLLEVRGERDDVDGLLFGLDSADESIQLTIGDDIDLWYFPTLGVIELSWRERDSDEITVAFDRLGQWTTIVGMAHADEVRYPDEPEWVRRAWVDLGGSSQPRPALEPFMPTRWVPRQLL